MTKTKRPLGLIRYTTEAELSGSPAPKLRLRSTAYAALFVASLSALALTLGRKEFLEITVLRAPGSPYELVETSSGTLVVNHFRLDLSNQTGGETTVDFTLDEASRADSVELILPYNPLRMADRANQRVDFFVRMPRRTLNGGGRKAKLLLRSDGREREMDLSLVGPDA
jgi:hypothetical protein